MKTNGSKNESKQAQAKRWALNWFEAMCLAEEREDWAAYDRAKESYETWCERAGIDPT